MKRMRFYPWNTKYFHHQVCRFVWLFFSCTSLITVNIRGQVTYELNKNWYCKPATQIRESGEVISAANYHLDGWMQATVPGTVLTTLLNNGQVPDPFYGMNNKRIPDIYYIGRDHYTYWFVKDFNETLKSGEQVWLNLRGINYSCDVFLNGRKLNTRQHSGMYLRQSYLISSILSKDGKNRLAVIVYPPDPVGNPNGGQGGDGVIARNISHQYVAGWDWIQPIPDRNTGIWDKVTIQKTRWIRLKNPYIKTLVPGIRFPGRPQEPAIVEPAVEVENPGNISINGTLQFSIGEKTINKSVTIQPYTTIRVEIPEVKLYNPRLWWPNGYGEPYLYESKFVFVGSGNQILDEIQQNTGIREIKTVWNNITHSAQVLVNGQKIFIKGGNWIISDALLRLSDERYDAEVRFHRDMNLNLIRVWGGALLERPEFFDACDKFGMLVFQDLWMSGDCNGKWLDPLKKDDQWTRRNYPDDHALFISSVCNQIKMIRNHPSLAFWCGGNEITPPSDILKVLQDSVFPILDGTRYFFPYSNSSEMSVNSLGGNGDGPYTIQYPEIFWDYRTFPFNSEVGSVGTGDIYSLERFIPKDNLVVPDYLNNKVDSVWQYHKDLGYGNQIDRYGKAKDITDFGNKAQLVNYEQYRALMEGFSSHQWDWYSGVIIWKTQNPWTALRGQMYDYYLDPNACLYGLRNAAESLHVMCNPVDGMLQIVNNSFETKRDLMLQVKTFDMEGNQKYFGQLLVEIGATSVQKYFSLKDELDKTRKEKGLFLQCRLLNLKKEVLSDNLYWLPDSTGNYSGLQRMGKAGIKVITRALGEQKIEVTIVNPAQGPIAFFNRLSLLDSLTHKRILPVFYSNNYISVLPGEEGKVVIDYSKAKLGGKPLVSVSGWNVDEQLIEITGQ